MLAVAAQCLVRLLKSITSNNTYWKSLDARPEVQQVNIWVPTKLGDAFIDDLRIHARAVTRDEDDDVCFCAFGSLEQLVCDVTIIGWHVTVIQELSLTERSHIVVWTNDRNFIRLLCFPAPDVY